MNEADVKIKYYFGLENFRTQFKKCGSPEIRTQDQPVKSRMLYR